MSGIKYVYEYDRELFRDEGQRPWIIRLRVVVVLSRLQWSTAPRRRVFYWARGFGGPAALAFFGDGAKTRHARARCALLWEHIGI